MLFCSPDFFGGLAIAVLMMGGVAHAAQADGERSADRGGLAAAQADANWKAECGSCHITFEPALLPAESWRKIMGGLNRHFGTDATVPAQVREEITVFLVSNSNNHWTEPATPLRITETGWFKHRHSERNIPSYAWQDPAVMSPANCAACHARMKRSHSGIRQH